MNKTIINGIDVSECVHLDEWKHCNICKELIKTIPDRHQCLMEKDLRCEYYSDCYFKQFKRLQQENEKLKNKNNVLIEEIASVNIDIVILQEENEELKEKIDIYENSIIANHDRAVGKRLMEVLQTLEEIREKAQKHIKAEQICFADEIINLINEVLK